MDLSSSVPELHGAGPARAAPLAIDSLADLK